MKRLFVVVHGFSGGFDRWDGLLQRLKAEPSLGESQWLLWNHGRHWYSLAAAEQLAVDLRARIDQEWVARGPFEEIVLVGHSIGGVLVRQAYLFACGSDTIVRQPSPWAKQVSRIILFAAVNRGIDPNRKYRKWWGRWFPVIVWFFRALPPLQRLLAWDILRGSDFITNLRIQWIRLFDDLGERAPVVVQLLGTKDDLVTRDDSVDVEQFASAYYIEIPEATHRDLYQLDVASDPEGRYALLRDAFVHARPKNAQNIQVRGPDKVVFVVHGIRSNNREDWVKQAIEKINSRWPHVEAIGLPYPYVSAVQFAIPMTRKRYLRWLKDEYSNAIARNPRARFNFIGHSNGTYPFGECLRRIPGMQFDRAVLVGSVLPVDYEWDQRVSQVTSLRVDGSSRDWPVGWLCSALRSIGMKDIGTSGVNGFERFGNVAKEEYFWYDGGHSEPLTKANLDALVEYAVTGNVIAPTSLCGESKWFAGVSRGLRRLTPFLVIALLGGFSWLVYTNLAIAFFVFVALVLVIIVLDIT